MQKHMYEDLPEVLFQEERLLRFIREEFTTIVHDMKRAGHIDSLEIVGSWGLARAVEKLITEHALAVEADISSLRDALGRMPHYIGSLDTLGDMISSATSCVNTFSFILKMFGGRLAQSTREKIEEELLGEA